MANWTSQQLADYEARRKFGGPSRSSPARGNAKNFALGRLPVGVMNKTEAAYAAHLETQKIGGAVLWYKFDAIRLRLADNTFYTCDFIVLPDTGFLELHEVKGFWEDDARVKIKVAAALYPFRFIAVTVRAKKHGGGWEREEFSR